MGILYVVGTPIGNLEDMTFRSIKTLQTVDLIAAEDTRHTGKLLQHFQITTPQVSYHDHNRTVRQADLIQHLQQGKNIALVTDAGMPGISDPGYELIKACLEENIEVIPIPGVTAGITALAVSGLPTDRFIFEGFLPTKNKERSDRLSALVSEDRTIIIYEAPHRLLETLEDLGKILGKTRKIVIARELTKLYEEFWRGTLGEAIKYYQTHSPKGELTLILGGVDGSEKITLSDEQLKTELGEIMKQGISRSQASRQLAQITGISRRRLYELALKVDIMSENEKNKT